ncbi:MAG: carbonic anhydrase [Gammaproteobacteria bacterium]|nr:carbonic anhydrase [Gammaproteobacteria bacterium]MCP5200054.1 carbonic anhydrase [Gammaproteobacteria bacterium]
MPRLAAGVVKFRRDVFPHMRELFHGLAAGQKPEALFITCSDSRIDPTLITQTEPGELFICRNAGNVVPPHTNDTDSMTAAIEFAVGALEVPHVVICGHTHCGALRGAMHPEQLGHLPHVSEWLGYTRAALQTVEQLGAGLDEAARMQMLIEQNVLMQMRHIQTHPYVAARLAVGKLRLHGWIYDIESGAVSAWDERAQAFADVETVYAEDVARYLATLPPTHHLHHD